MLELEDVDRTFGDVTALQGLTLRVGAGEVVGLLGHNGAGKTTSVRLLAGLLAPDRGRVRVDGIDPVEQGPAVRRRLGVLPSRPVVDDRLTGAENLRFAADVFDVPATGIDERIRRALEAFDLAERADERVAGYSTGMRQRLSLARVLLPDPEVLLLDEPTSALDPIAARQVRGVLADLAREQHRTVVLCTHDLAEADELCDRVVVLEHGRVVADGSPAALAAEHGTGGLLVEVAAEDVEAVRQRLQALGSDHVEVIAAGRLRATGIPRSRVPSLVAALVDEQIDVFEVRRLEPTLEQVYLALHTGERDGDGGDDDDEGEGRP